MKKVNIILIFTAVSFLTWGFIKVESKAPGTPQIGIEVGNTAPELKFTSPQGKEIALSSLRGKIVLLDFWASWCGPCRGENPNVVEIYNKYKETKFNKKAKGFTVYSVSLDYNKTGWVNAITKDGLLWENHVSDLEGWKSKAAAIYSINSIPAGFLIDENGVIVAKGTSVRGSGLEAELKKLMKN